MERKYSIETIHFVFHPYFNIFSPIPKCSIYLDHYTISNSQEIFHFSANNYSIYLGQIGIIYEPFIFNYEYAAHYFPSSSTFVRRHQNDSLNLLTFKNFFATWFSGFFMNNTFFLTDHHCQWWTGMHSKRLRILFSKQVLSIAHTSTQIYGHMIIDLLPALLMVPIRIKKSSIILFPSKTLFPYLIQVGYNFAQLYTSEYDDVILCSRLYTYQELQCECLKPFLLAQLHHNLYSIFNLSQEKPFQYVLYNRPYGLNRHILNFEEILITIRSKLPNIKWEHVHEKYEFIESGKMACQFKFLFGIHNSFFGNIIFMKESSIVCEYQHNFFINGTMWRSWTNFIILGLSLKLHYALTRGIEFTQWDYNNLSQNLPVPIITTFINLSLLFFNNLV